MSPPRKGPDRSSFTIADEWLNSNIQAIAKAITAKTFSRRPELRKRFGKRGMLKCEQDALYHLHYLSEAIANNSPQMFVDYVGWAKIMLISRGIDPADLREHLEEMSHVLRSKAPPKCQKIFVEVITFALAQLPILPEALSGFIDAAKPFADVAESYLRSLLLLNREEGISFILRKVESGLPLGDLFRYVIDPVQQEVGRLWQENKITVLQEHYCTAATEMLIARLRRSFVGVPRAVTALTLCPAGEEHSLGIKMFSDLLESDGWKVDFIGSKCPISDVLKHIKVHATDLVAISVATPLNLAGAKQLIKEIRSLSLEHAPSIMVGGAVLKSKPDLLKYLAADAAPSDITEGVEIANRLVARGAA
jgi:MerR family transcriptional regulator, light-induced transcriptional regulator